MEFDNGRVPRTGVGLAVVAGLLISKIAQFLMALIGLAGFVLLGFD